MPHTDTTPRASSRSRFFSSKRLACAGLAMAACGCAAACALPMLAALGVGGTVTAVAHVALPGTEIAVASAAVASALVLGVGWLRWRRRRQPASFFSCAAVPATPVVCTGDHTLARRQIDGYRAAFQHLVDVDAIPHGFRWTFRARPGLAAELRTLAEREAGCCRFISYDIIADGDRVIWESTGDASAAAVIEEIARLPQRLRDEPRPDRDLAALKRDAEAAGLRFTVSPGTGGRD